MMARKEYKYAQEEYQKTICAKSEDKISLGRWRLRMNEALQKIDNVSLGLEHFFREIGILYSMSLLKNPDTNSYMKLAQSYADLLIAGQEIELPDGDSSTITGPWLSAICHNVCQKVPKLKIFVVSIIGLQSSGKSTLLNAMFASKFAVSVGRCTRGLFMRLLFIDEEMKRDMKLKFDALLLIDTEGLGAPERQNEPDSEKKDRVMATFAMGVSHLTIINVLGEYMNNLTEILQIAIISMARLEQVKISPDILMVQHLTERDNDKMRNATKQFSDALENAIDMADHKDLSLGVRNSNCLKKLRNTILMGKMLRRFRPFKNGASANSPPSEEYHQDVIALYKAIIETAQFSDMGQDFEDWSQLIQNYWESIKGENFMRFKDVKELQSFLDTSDKIFLLKESIETCFKEHSELKPFLNESANKINKNEITIEKVIEELRNKFNGIPNTCPLKPACDCCVNFMQMRIDFYFNLKGKPNELDVKTTIQKYISATKEYYIKHLTQKLSALAIREIESDETFRKIITQLEKHLKIKTKFNETDIYNITKEIMADLEREANEKVIQVDVISEIEQEIQYVYYDMPLKVNSINLLNLKSLRHQKAFDLKKVERIRNYFNLCDISTCLSNYQCYQLEGKLESTARDILKVEKVETYSRGMVQKMKKQVTQILKDFEESEKIKFISNFKWKAIEYAIKHFMKYMSEQQDNWNKDNNPLIVFRNNREKYLKWIGDKLRYGFGYYSDGSEAGVNILRAIIQKAIKVANDRKEQEFNSQRWISNSSRIRLKYFEELVDDINKNELDSSLKFFRNPKYYLEQWYGNRLTNCLSDENLMVIYKVNQQNLMDSVEKKLKELDSIETKQKFIKEFVSDCDEIDLRFTHSAFGTTRADTDMFDRGIDEAFEREKKQMFSDNNIQFVDLTKDRRFWNRLGCTESCPYCSAICWMPWGHESDVGDSKKHHTCHQPMGFTGSHDRYTNRLNVDPCHDQKHIEIWYSNDIPLNFLDLIKERGYIHKWKFEAHTENHFNELMCWFFFKLHKEIAKSYELKSADDQELRDYNMYKIGDRIEVIKLHVMDKVYKKE